MRYRITYLQELVQPLTAHTLESAATFAKNYARNNFLIVAKIEPVVEPELTSPPPTA